MKYSFIYARTWMIAFLVGMLSACGQSPTTSAGSGNGKTDSFKDVVPCESDLCGCLSQPFADLICDGNLSPEEWTGATSGFLQDSPQKASPQAREVLALWAFAEVDMDDATRGGLRGFLRSRGYNIPAGLKPPVSANILADLVPNNVSETDRLFEKLLALVGDANDQLIIAAVDGGFDVTHPALLDKFWFNDNEVAGNGIDDDQNGYIDDLHGWSFIGQSGQLDSPPYGVGTGEIAHGCHVAGIVTRGTNKLKLVGAQLVDTQRMPEALAYVIAQGARVVNLSIGVSGGPLPKTMELISTHPDILFVHAAGNDTAQITAETHRDSITAQLLPNLVHIAASGDDDLPLSDTNYGLPFITLADHAKHYSTVPLSFWREGFMNTGKTSQASPNVANVAAKCRLIHPGMSPAQIQALLLAASDAKEEWAAKVVSGGLVNHRRTLLACAFARLYQEGLNIEDISQQLALEAEEASLLMDLVQDLPANAGT